MTAFLAAQGAAALAGALLLLAVGAGRMPIGLFVATAWLGGTGALAAQRLLYAQAGIAWSPVALTLPWIIMAGLVGIRLRRSWPSRSSWSSWSKKLRAQATVASILADAAAVTVIAVWTALLLRQAVNTPLAGWDAMAIWFLKGRAFFETGGMPWGFFADPRFPPYAHLDYPLLVPLTIAGTYAWTGDLDTLMKGWWPLLAGATAAALYWGPAGRVGRLARLGGLALVLCLPELRSHAAGYYVGYADLPLAAMLLFGAVFLYRWLQSWERGAFFAAALFFCLAGFTKNEGLVVTVTGMSLLISVALAKRQLTWVSALGALGCLLLIVLPWQLQRQALGIDGEFSPTVDLILANWPARSGLVWDAFLRLMVDPQRFNVLWLMFPLLGVAALAFAPRRWLEVLPLLALWGAHVMGMVLAYVVTPNDVTFQLATSADRVLFQTAPLMALITTMYLGMLLDWQQVTLWSGALRAAGDTRPLGSGVERAPRP